MDKVKGDVPLNDTTMGSNSHCVEIEKTVGTTRSTV